MSSITVDFDDLENVTADVIVADDTLEIVPEGLKVSQLLLDLIDDIPALPAGGTSGQVLKKFSNDDFEADWSNENTDLIPAGGTTGQVLKKATGADFDIFWDDDEVGGTVSAFPSTVVENFTFVSNGDTNGLLYRIGTNFGIQAWANPHTAGRVTFWRRSIINGANSDFCDRINQYNTTDNTADEWIAVDLGVNRSMVLSDYLVRNGAADGANAPKNWKIQGSNNVATNDTAGANAATWVDIDTRTNNTTIAQTIGAWGHFTLGSVPAGYRWLRMKITGLNQAGLSYLQVSELEFYGTLTYGAIYTGNPIAVFHDEFTVKPGVNDGTSPTTPGTVAGYIKSSINGTNIWIPYYQ